MDRQIDGHFGSCLEFDNTINRLVIKGYGFEKCKIGKY